MHIEPVRQQVAADAAAVAERQAAGTGAQEFRGDPFDGSSEPIVYMSDNRMPVVIEFSSAIIYIVFAALLLALVAILPGVRRKKLASFLGLVTLLTVGASILLALEGSHWLTGELQVHEATYGALTSETITGKLEVNIGLRSTNVTLYGRLMGDTSEETGDSSTSGTSNDNNNNNNNSESVDNRRPATSTSDSGHEQHAQTPRNESAHATRQRKKLVDYNEQFHWDKPDRMESEHQEALRRGLPYPILTVTEFLSRDSDGFNWMRQLRSAGYFASFALYAALVSWCLTALVMCMVPLYLPHMMQATGALMMASVWIYTLLIQSPKSFVIQLGASPMEFAFGYTYVLAFVAGAVSVFAGIMMYILQLNRPHDQLTIMDCDSYLKDQQALYGSRVAAQHDGKKSDVSSNA